MSLHSSNSGKGRRANAYEAVQRFRYDSLAPDRSRQSESSAVFGNTAVKGVFDILEDEPVFLEIDKQPVEWRSVPLLRASLNGTGSEAKSLFPGDEEFQAIMMEENIRYFGTSTENYTEEMGDRVTGFGVKTYGGHNDIALVNVPYGCYLKLTVFPPSKMKNIAKRKGQPTQKYTPVPVPWDPKPLSAKFKSMMNKMLKDRTNWDKMCDSNYKKFGRRYNALSTINDSKLLAGILMIEKFAKIGLISINRRSTDGDIILAPGNGAFPQGNQSDAALLLAHGLELMGDESYPIPHMPPLSRPAKDKMRQMKRELLLGINWDGEYANCGFGYNEQTNTNPGINDLTGMISSKSAYGRMLLLQVNLWINEFIQYNDFIDLDRGNIMGKTVRGGQAGSPIQYYN